MPLHTHFRHAYRGMLDRAVYFIGEIYSRIYPSNRGNIMKVFITALIMLAIVALCSFHAAGINPLKLVHAS